MHIATLIPRSFSLATPCLCIYALIRLCCPLLLLLPPHAFPLPSSVCLKRFMQKQSLWQAHHAQAKAITVPTMSSSSQLYLCGEPEHERHPADYTAVRRLVVITSSHQAPSHTASQCTAGPHQQQIITLTISTGSARPSCHSPHLPSPWPASLARHPRHQPPLPCQLAALQSRSPRQQAPASCCPATPPKAREDPTPPFTIKSAPLPLFSLFLLLFFICGRLEGNCQALRATLGLTHPKDKVMSRLITHTSSSGLV